MFFLLQICLILLVYLFSLGYALVILAFFLAGLPCLVLLGIWIWEGVDEMSAIVCEKSLHRHRLAERLVGALLLFCLLYTYISILAAFSR
jgi:hypothetical protein